MSVSLMYLWPLPCLSGPVNPSRRSARLYSRSVLMKACSPRVYEHDHYSASQRASKQFYFCPAHWTVLMASSPFYRQAEIANPQIAVSADLSLAVYLCVPPVLWRKFLMWVLCMCAFRGTFKICCILLKVTNTALLPLFLFSFSFSFSASQMLAM